MKKALAMILALCMMALLFCGCDREEDTSTDSVVPPVESEVETLTVQDVKDSITEIGDTFGYANAISSAGTKELDGNAVLHNFNIFNNALSLLVTEKDGVVEEIIVGGYWMDFKSGGKSDEEAIDMVTSVSLLAIRSCTGAGDQLDLEDKLLATTPVKNGEYTNYEYSQNGWSYQLVVGPDVVSIAAWPK